MRTSRWHAKIITLAPEIFPGALASGVVGRALRDNRWSLEIIDLRAYGIGRHNTVDDTPAGGGAGMVLRADVVAKALIAAGAEQASTDCPLVFLTPGGRRFTQKDANSWAQKSGITILSARYEGVDQRVIDHFKPEEISLGDFVLSGGDIAAQAMIDASVRLMPNVLGNPQSLGEESFAKDLLEYPHYTRPALWENREIPEVLLSGNHEKIALWRRAMAQKRTKARRPDLWRAYLRRSKVALAEKTSIKDAQNHDNDG